MERIMTMFADLIKIHKTPADNVRRSYKNP